METDSDFKAIAKKMVKGKKATPKVSKPKEPTDAMGWLKKARESEIKSMSIIRSWPVICISVVHIIMITNTW